MRATLWWVGMLALAASVSLAVHRGLRSWQPSTVVRMSTAEIPAGWEALPIAAHLEDVKVAKSVDFMGEGYGTATYHARLGPFSVTWSETLIKGVNAGERGWEVEHPLSGSCRAASRARYYPAHPDTLRVDEAAGIYVLEEHGEGKGEARVACRREVAAIGPPAFAQKPDLRLAASIAAGVLLVWFSWMVRSSWHGGRRRSSNPARSIDLT
jgi:hypothetical protein